MKFNFLKNESYKKGIVFSTALNLLSKFLLFLQSVIIAYYFGTEATTDVFFYCFATITLLALFVNNLDTSILIPEAMRLREQASEQRSMQFLNCFLFGYLFFGILVSTLFYIAPVDLFLILSNFDEGVLQSNSDILLLSIPLFTLSITTNLMVNILSSYKFFTIPMLISSFNGLIALLAIVLLHGLLNIKSALIGLILAYVINIGFLLFLMRKTIRWKFTISVTGISRRILKNIFYAQAGNITSVLCSYVPIYLLSGFGPGVVTSLTYGQKTAELPNQLITQQFSSVTGIKFNELYAQQRLEELNRIFRSVAHLLLFTLTPISALIFLFDQNIIAILFQRGHFDNASVARSAMFLKYLGLLLPLLAINTLIARLLMATQKIKVAFIYQTILNGILIGAMIIAVDLWGAIGYPYALVAVHSANLLLSYYLLKMAAPYIHYAGILRYVLKVVFFNGCIAASIYYLNLHVFDSDHVWINTIVGTMLYAGLALTLNFVLRLNTDVNILFSSLKKYR